MSKPNATATLPDGVSLRRVAEVLLDAWEAGSHQWTGTPLQLREGPTPVPSVPLPQDTMDLFQLLQERQVDYLLVGGMAMLTYVPGRNTKDVDLLLSGNALEKIPELTIEDRNEFFARGKFRSIQVDLLLTANPLFQMVRERFATKHPFKEMEIPAASVEGMVVLKLYALPSLYRQFDWPRIKIYEGDISTLLELHRPDVAPLLKLLKPHVLPTDFTELQKIILAEQKAITEAKDRFPKK